MPRNPALSWSSAAWSPPGPAPWTGLRFAVKDLFDLKGYVTGCGNPRWRDTHPPAAAHAVAVEQILAAGAVCLGKTVTDELAFGLDGENHFYGTPLNPRAPDRVPGGSSSGSASAVACGLVDFALGTDTGGSVRVPASNCGLFGIRTTHGRVSLAGVNPLALSLDTVGVLAGSADTLARAAAVLLAVEVPETAAVGAVHVLQEPLALVDSGVREALGESLDGLHQRFAGRVRETSINAVVGLDPDAGLQPWYETFFTIQWAEIWSSLGTWVEAAKPDLGPRTRQNFANAKGLDRRQVGEAARRRERYFRQSKGLPGPPGPDGAPHGAGPGAHKGDPGPEPHPGELLPPGPVPHRGGRGGAPAPGDHAGGRGGGRAGGPVPHCRPRGGRLPAGRGAGIGRRIRIEA